MAPHNPRVTVLMSVYNGERFLREAVESILSQSFSDFEFIIIDDGSTDSTGHILSAYHDARISVFQQDNTGLTRALNRGLSFSRGQYVARIDANDVARRDRLEKQLAFLEANPDIVLLASDHVFIDDHGAPVRTRALPAASASLKWLLLFHNCICHSSVMFRKKEMLSLGGYDEAFRYAQDYDLWLRAAGRYRLGSLGEPLLSYRQPGRESLSQAKSQEQAACARHIRGNAFRSLGLDEEALSAGIDELKNLLLYNGMLSNVKKTEALFDLLFEAFSASSFCHGEPQHDIAALAREFSATVARQSLQHAWTCYHQGDMPGFRFHVLQAMRRQGMPSALHQTWLLLKSFFAKKRAGAQPDTKHDPEAQTPTSS